MMCWCWPYPAPEHTVTCSVNSRDMNRRIGEFSVRRFSARPPRSWFPPAWFSSADTAIPSWRLVCPPHAATFCIKKTTLKRLMYIMSEQNTDARSLVYTKWNYKYYMVFAPKYRRKVFFRDKRVDDFFCYWEILSEDEIAGERAWNQKNPLF